MRPEDRNWVQGPQKGLGTTKGAWGTEGSLGTTTGPGDHHYWDKGQPGGPRILTVSGDLSGVQDHNGVWESQWGPGTTMGQGITVGPEDQNWA